MKKLLLLCFALLLLCGGLARPVLAASPSDSCNQITLEKPQLDACTLAAKANPKPDLERPVVFNPKMDGVSQPRSVLLPKEPMPFEIGWLIRDWYYSDAPGIDPPKWTKDRIIRKATVIYVYATVKVRGLDWNMIGPDQWIPGEYVAVLHIPKRPEGVSGRWITLDLTEQTLIAMEDDTPIFATLISAAYDAYGVTREGLFHIYARTKETIFRGPPWAKVPEYVLNHVPDVMFFDEHIALHGAYWHDWFGFPRSHGCVNIPVGDEHWLWNWVSETADKWGPDENKFFLPHPEQAPFVYVYRSAKVKKS